MTGIPSKSIAEVVEESLLGERNALIIRLGQVEDALIARGRLSHRTIPPKKERKEQIRNGSRLPFSASGDNRIDIS